MRELPLSVEKKHHGDILACSIDLHHVVGTRYLEHVPEASLLGSKLNFGESLVSVLAKEIIVIIILQPGGFVI